MRVAAALLLLLALAGCGETVDQVHHDAQFTKACHDAGGKVVNEDPGLYCDFADQP